MERARTNVPVVIRAFMRVEGISQEHLGDALGLRQGAISRRLTKPGALSQEELAAIAAYFGVPIGTFYKPWREAIHDLPDADTLTRAIPGWLHSAIAAA